MSIGVPIKVLHEAEGHVVTCETNTGEVYRGKLIEAEDNMNCQMANITVTHRDGRVAQLEQVYIRGSKIRFLILPDMLKNAPMLKSMKNKNQAAGAGRGKAAILKAQGVQTGRCGKYSETIKTCEVFSWCPIENDNIIPKTAVLGDAEDFTVLIKNSIHYPKFNFKKRNILEYINTSYLKTCTFNRKTDPDCPIFRLGDIVAEAGEVFSVMAVKGGVIGIFIDWSCDLDFPERFCVPKYSFSRLDNKRIENNVAPGYNFRFAKYFKTSENVETRTLFKAYGIRFEVIVLGQAGKFSIVPTIVNIGATLALLSLAGAVCDWFMLTFMKDGDYYAKHKFIHLNDRSDSGSSVGTPSYGTP
ncbi:putative purinergic receptor P2X4b [Triplophysa rosa]|uniref:P2X purinoceptor n=1 Tax=Triplophysa rosa TaxID=992332 RepID=A0A9W7TI29_TRIRA|nr:putative purinergic receptor P2X4b [Triplophysa rosa]